MPASRRRDSKQMRIFHNQVAQAVFEAAAATGITEREKIELLVDRVLHQLEHARPLPGMEGLVSPTASGGAALGQVQSLVEQALAQASPEPAEGARPQTPEPQAPRPELTKTEKVPASPGRDSPLKEMLTPNAITVLERRYLKKDDKRQVIETVEDMFRRVAHNIAQAELLYNPRADVAGLEEEFYQLMTRLEFLPNSPTLMNAGRELQQLSACFVLPVEDSMESIFDAIKYTALIHKSGGGTGFSFSRLRPESDIVGSTGGVASGPVSFMRAFDTATDVIKQGGTRRGANMAILNVDHPDILKFIRAKEDNISLQNFNISVAATEKFMQAVEQGEDYDLINPRTGRAEGRLNAREVLNQMVEMAWRNGDPGIVFLDRINRDNPTPKLGAIESTNPCGEQPLLPYESCNLGSINLSQFLAQKDGPSPEGEVDWEGLGRTVDLAVRFLDNVIDMSRFPIPRIAETTRASRKIGLGVMGFADMLILMGIPYDSEQALQVGEEVMRFINQRATRASAALAEERGAFPAFQDSIYYPDGPRLRNATRTTIAPTGTLSIIAGCSSGIEPLFALSYTRNILDNDKLAEVHPLFQEAARAHGFDTPEVQEAIARKGCAREVEGIPDWARRVFVTAHDIPPEWHVRMQAAFQRHTDNAVSKTINFPQEAAVEDVARAYMLAYQEGCKGITIYRDRSRERQVLAVAGEDERKAPAGIQPRPRHITTRGETRKVTTGCGNLYVTVNRDEQGLCEVFSHLGKAGGCAAAQSEATSRLISLALRSGIDPESIVGQLRGIRCPSIAWDQGQAILSCPDALGCVLQSYLASTSSEQAHSAGSKPSQGAEGEANPGAKAASGGPPRNLAGQCPECSSLLIYQEGCYVCRACGYTKC